MAGFDFTIVCRDENQRSLVRMLLREAQRMAKSYELSVCYGWHQSAYCCTIDGRLPQIRCWHQALSDHLPAYARALSSPRPRSSNEDLAHLVVDRIVTSLEDFESELDSISGRLGGVPHSFAFRVGKLSHLTAQLDAFSDALTSYCRRRIQLTEVFEIAHTTLESVLGACLPRSEHEQRSFVDLVKTAVRRDLVDRQLLKHLVELNGRRRNAKHRSQRVSESHAHLLVAAIDACHMLLSRHARNTPPLSS